MTSTPEVLVTGGTGLLGRRVVDRLRAAGHETRVLSRSGRPGTVRGDLLTGEGLEEAVHGVRTVVHCASNPYRKMHRTEVEGTRHLIEAAHRAGVSHLVYVSVVGVDRNPHYPYYKAKLEAENVVERSPVPWTILCATQFHDFVLRFVGPLGRPTVALAPGGFLLQPVDAGEVADRLVELALAPPAGRIREVGGPEVKTAAELMRSYLEAVGRRKKLQEFPVPGKAARAFREGAQLCPEGRYGEITWQDFLHETFGR